VSQDGTKLIRTSQATYDIVRAIAKAERRTLSAQFEIIVETGAAALGYHVNTNQDPEQVG
jgi:hypothetical protein